MLFAELTMQSELLRQQGSAPGSINDPACGKGLGLTGLGFETHRVVLTAFSQSNFANGSWAEEIGPGFGCEIEHMLVEQSAVELEGGQAALKLRPQLRAVLHAVLRLAVEPHPQAMLLVVIST